MAETIHVSVVYALPDEVFQRSMLLPDGATVADAIRSSGVLARFPEIESGDVPAGIYSRRVQADQRLRDGDRVEVYRPLECDPKQARRRRAEKND